MIIENNIDPIEWKSEYLRVEKLLDIQEFPEFFMSGSSHSDNSTNNLNNNNIIFSENYEHIPSLNRYSSFLDSMIINNKNKKSNKNLWMLNKCSNFIDNQLKSINGFENRLSQSENMKNIVLFIIFL
jgi:hypothetical protein